ncbi:Transketolase domain protein [Syntrophobacter sp. SbD1]|nr:Transketolase domain protein [Syntrophobacter sp. SbD1]
MFKISLDQASLSDQQKTTLGDMWLRCMRRIIMSTTLAGSGHPGGSMSSLHLLLMLYSTIEHDPCDSCWEGRDRLIVSMGHISPAVYSVLSEFGYLGADDFSIEFRRAGSAFPGHVESCVPGIEWNTGNLGQGLSAATGMALALKLQAKKNRVFTLMGDGEQQKGQISEARRFASKYGLNNLACLIDRNYLQIGGSTNTVMPQDIRADYAAAHWNVVYVEDGHDFDQIFQALRMVHLFEAGDPRFPSAIIAHTIMGKGVSFMENKAKYHGSTLNESDAAKALEELGLDNPLAELKQRRCAGLVSQKHFSKPIVYPDIVGGAPRTYGPETVTDNRSAYGNALEDMAKLNNSGPAPKIVGFCCDLEGSVKMDGFHKVSENAFFESGIQEHHTATVSGAISREGFAAFFSTFGVFGVTEVFNQVRLNDINSTNLKLVCTHVGLDVGEDGQTHQCIDYIGLLRNLFGFSIFMPADPNQTDRIVRYVAEQPGNFFVGMGRSKLPAILDEAGQPAFAGDYRFTPGKADWLRHGGHAAILAHGRPIHEAVKACEELSKNHGVDTALLNFASIRPLDAEAIAEAAKTGLIVTVEDHHIDTGLGSLAAAVLAENALPCRLVRLGVKKYGFSGTPEELYNAEGIDREGIVKAVLNARK